MTQHDPESESPDAADLATTRRNTLKATGGLGLGSLLQLGGGPEADAMSEYRVPTYRVPESDLDSPGVVGRRVEITSGGATYETGDQLVDTGSSWELIDAGVGSLNTEELRGIADRIFHGADQTPASEINNELSEQGNTIIIAGDNTHLEESLQIGADNVSLIIPSGATVGLADGFDASLFTSDGAPVVYCDGYSGVQFHNHGTIDCNQSNTNLSFISAARFVNSSDFSIDGDGSNAVDCNTAYLTTDCSDFIVRNLYSDYFRESVGNAQGCTRFRIDNIIGDARGGGGKEVFDLGAHNDHGLITNITGYGGSLNVVESFANRELTIKNIHGDEGVGRLFDVKSDVPSTSDPQTTRSPFSDANNITVDGITGKAKNWIVLAGTDAQDKDMQNLTIEGIDATTTTDSIAVELMSRADNRLDGLTLKGHIRAPNQTSTTSCVEIGQNTGQTEDVNVDITVEGSGNAAVFIASTDRVSGNIHVINPPDKAVDVFAHSGFTCNGHNLSVTADGAAEYGVRYRGKDDSLGDGTCSNNKIDGSVTASGTRDVKFSAAAKDSKFIGVADTTADDEGSNQFV